MKKELLIRLGIEESSLLKEMSQDAYEARKNINRKDRTTVKIEEGHISIIRNKK